MKKKTAKKTVKEMPKKQFLFKITATQEFNILYDIEAVSEEAAHKAIMREFKDIQIDHQWTSVSLEDDKMLSPYWTANENAKIFITLEE